MNLFHSKPKEVLLSEQEVIIGVEEKAEPYYGNMGDSKLHKDDYWIVGVWTGYKNDKKVTVEFDADGNLTLNNTQRGKYIINYENVYLRHRIFCEDLKGAQLFVISIDRDSQNLKGFTKISGQQLNENEAIVSENDLEAREDIYEKVDNKTSEETQSDTQLQNNATSSTSSEKGVIINGVRWATRNVGAPGTFVANPENVGMFYQWNRRIGWSSTDPMIASNGSTTWNNTGATGAKWTKTNDPCPMGWRVPTEAELSSLVITDKSWTSINGVKGLLLGSDNNSIFLPAAGYRGFGYSGTLTHDGSLNKESTGNYWSSTPIEASAYKLYFGSNSNTSAQISYVGGADALNVRCVCLSE